MKNPEENNSRASLTPSKPQAAKPSATRPRRNLDPSIEAVTIEPSEDSAATIVIPQPESERPTAPRGKIRPLKPIVINTTLDTTTETQTLTKQPRVHQFRTISPASITELQESRSSSPLSPEIKPFYDVLYAKIIRNLIKNTRYEDVSQAEKTEIAAMCVEITLAIAHFQEIMQEDPATYCRSAEGMILWTEKRHLEIKKLQTNIKPHFDRINQLLTQKNHHDSPIKQLYSSPTGRQQAAKYGDILETTPFGKILESTSIHTMLKRCFGPNAFTPAPNTSKAIYKEVDGEINRIKKNSPRDLLTNQSVEFTTDVDTAVVIGVWEAVSSSYAQETANEAHIYVPFGIGANTVAWNHEIPELRKNFSDKNIIIHTLRSPETYAAFKTEYESKQSG